MKAYILSIAGVVLISAIVTIIAPNGKMGKFVKGTVRLFILVVMLAPFIGWIRGREFKALESANIGEDSAYLAHCRESIEAEDTREIAAYISETFEVSAQVEVIREDSAYFPLSKISVKVDWDGINGGDERIHIMTCIQEALTARYGAETEVA